jgi:hypothetical protein
LGGDKVKSGRPRQRWRGRPVTSVNNGSICSVRSPGNLAPLLCQVEGLNRGGTHA